MSLQTQHDPKNEGEITYWNNAGGRRWVERQQPQDIVLWKKSQIRWSTGTRMVWLMSRLYIADPETLPDGPGSLAVEVVGATRARCLSVDQISATGHLRFLDPMAGRAREKNVAFP
jgi:hypothetical protein